jgi:hypothetical protein
MVGENGDTLAFQDREILGCLFGTHDYLVFLRMAQKGAAQ